MPSFATHTHKHFAPFSSPFMDRTWVFQYFVWRWWSGSTYITILYSEINFVFVLGLLDAICYVVLRSNLNQLRWLSLKWYVTHMRDTSNNNNAMKRKRKTKKKTLWERQFIVHNEVLQFRLSFRLFLWKENIMHEIEELELFRGTFD